jgi:hypothetical protein
MDSLLQRVERERPGERDDQLAVEHEPFRRQARQRVGDLGEVAAERLTSLGL